MSDIYREQLMDHYKHPHNRGKMDDAQVEITENNPMCGDVISMQLKVSDGKIEKVMFDGSACAVTIASSSVLTEALQGKTLKEAKKMSKDELLDLLGVELTTSRIKCASLPLDAIHALIKNYESEQTK
jgi:nitrogen fixation NifU-like protein